MAHNYDGGMMSGVIFCDGVIFKQAVWKGVKQFMSVKWSLILHVWEGDLLEIHYRERNFYPPEIQLGHTK